MGSVISLDEHRPHVTLTTQANTVHVIPVAFFEAVARGQLTVDDLDCRRDQILRLVVAEWLESIGVTDAWKLREMDDQSSEGATDR